VRAPPAAQRLPLPGHLADNVMHFGRVLRQAGLPLPTERIQLALTALQMAGLESKRDFHDTLAACLLDRVEHRELFDQAFEIFWRDPDVSGRGMALLLPQLETPIEPPLVPENRRLGEALFPHQPKQPQTPPPPEQLEVDAVRSWNDRERLRKADFDTMTADEWRAAQALLRRLTPLFEPLRTRRSERAAHPGLPDGRATLQALARHGGDVWQMRWQRPRSRPAPLVVLADISGSMRRYSRMLLHFTHALSVGGGGAAARVETFVFGTRLTRCTRALKQRDPDTAVARVVRDVADWSGGTRITACLRDFNRHWARRVLSGRATVLLISDGLEHGTPDDPRCEGLAFEMERLHKSCRKLIWLNPLLRFDQFQPRAAGIKAMLPNTDLFLPAHNLQSLEELARVLGGHTAPARFTAPGVSGR
jgi:uncharacterized protein with von Willebrand factor type A (vWA) domain